MILILNKFEFSDETHIGMTLASGNRDREKRHGHGQWSPLRTRPRTRKSRIVFSFLLTVHEAPAPP